MILILILSVHHFHLSILFISKVPMADYAGDEHKVDCWMDVTKGRFPSNTPISGPVKVGENLTLAIYIRDSRKNTDIRVKDCYAYDNEKSINESSPALLQLSSDDGCPLKPKLMDVWRRTSNTGDSGATVIAYSTVTVSWFEGSKRNKSGHESGLWDDHNTWRKIFIGPCCCCCCW